MERIWITIPSGERHERAAETFKRWKDAGLSLAVYAWDELTREAAMVLADMVWGAERKSFAILQNFLVRNLPGEWDAVICGADDLWPNEGTELLPQVVEAAQGKVIWVRDGLFDQQPTHPIVTRKWYEKHNGYVFDEAYRHNFVDTDLAVRCCHDNELVKCFDIGFDHRHYMKTNAAQDGIYKAGMKTWDKDQEWFNAKWPDVDLAKMLWCVPKLELKNGCLATA